MKAYLLANDTSDGAGRPLRLYVAGYMPGDPAGGPEYAWTHRPTNATRFLREEAVAMADAIDDARFAYWAMRRAEQLANMRHHEGRAPQPLVVVPANGGNPIDRKVPAPGFPGFALPRALAGRTGFAAGEMVRGASVVGAKHRATYEEALDRWEVATRHGRELVRAENLYDAAWWFAALEAGDRWALRSTEAGKGIIELPSDAEVSAERDARRRREEGLAS